MWGKSLGKKDRPSLHSDKPSDRQQNQQRSVHGAVRTSRRKVLQSVAAGVCASAFRISIVHAASPKIPIGFPVPLTGPYAKEALDQVRSAQLAVDQFNALGGLDGREVELLVRDDTLTPGVAAALTHDLIANQGAKFIVGSLSAAVQLSVAHVAGAAGAVYVSISQSDAINEAANTGPLTFHEALNPHMTCQALGGYVFGRSNLRVAYLVADYAYGHEMARGMKRVAQDYGAQSVVEIHHPIATEDFSLFLPRILQARPDVLCLCNFGRDQMHAVRDATNMGLKDAMRLVAPVMLYHQRLDGGAKIYDGVIGATNYHWTLERELPSAKAFNDAYRSRFNAPPSDYGAYGYGGVSALLTGMKEAGVADPKAVAEVMRTMTYEHCKGPQQFRACDGQSVQAVFVVASKAQADMQNEYDVFDILGVQNGDERFLRTCTELGYALPIE